MENAQSRASKVHKIMDSISTMSRKALISFQNKARGQPSDVDEDEDELIELELSELEKPGEQPIEVSDDENESISPKKNKLKT